MFKIILIFLFLICVESFASDPSWIWEIHEGSYSLQLDRGDSIYFRGFAKTCKQAIKETEDRIDKAFPQKLYVPKDVLLVYESAQYNDCSVTLSVNKRKLNTAKNVSTTGFSYVSEEEEFRLIIKKTLKKNMNMDYLNKTMFNSIRVGKNNEIIDAIGSEICYNKFNSNATIYNTNYRFAFCLSDFNYNTSMLLGIWDDKEKEWILE